VDILSAVCRCRKCDVICVVVVSNGTCEADIPLLVPRLDMSVMAGEVSRLKLELESCLLECEGRGETSVVVGSEKMSDGVSISGVYVGRSWGGKAGSDLSTLGAGPGGGFLDFFRRRAISDSWQDMQKIPCEVRA
jgi:hypothetical protein